jgi:hypothetical protein
MQISIPFTSLTSIVSNKVMPPRRRSNVPNYSSTALDVVAQGLEYDILSEVSELDRSCCSEIASQCSPNGSRRGNEQDTLEWFEEIKLNKVSLHQGLRNHHELFVVG